MDHPPTLDYEPPKRRPPLRGVISGFLLVLVLTLWAAAEPVGDLLIPRRYGNPAFETRDLLPLIILIAVAFGAAIGFWRRKVDGFALGLLLGGVVSLATYVLLLLSGT